MIEQPAAESNQEKPPSKEELKREIMEAIARAIQGQESDSQKKEPSGDAKKEDEKREDDTSKKKKGFHWTLWEVVLAVAVVLIILVVGVRYLGYALSHEMTDDAYTTGYIHEISSRVTGNVTVLNVVDNQHVTAGQVLIQLDPRDYQVQVAKAQANFDNAKADFDRVEALRNDVAISKQDYDSTRTNMEVAKASLMDALNQLSYCTIVSPTDGYIGNRTVNLGNRVTVGGELMAVVQDIWVLANYKETQLGKMRKNQRVRIDVDAIPDHEFWGHIDSFSPGTGAVFSLLPPDNATGNFTKIVQRVPVKILFEPDSIRDFRARIVPGLSVETYVTLDKNVHPTGDQINKAGD